MIKTKFYLKILGLLILNISISEAAINTPTQPTNNDETTRIIAVASAVAAKAALKELASNPDFAKTVKNATIEGVKGGKDSQVFRNLAILTAGGLAAYAGYRKYCALCKFVERFTNIPRDISNISDKVDIRASLINKRDISIDDIEKQLKANGLIISRMNDQIIIQTNTINAITGQMMETRKSLFIIDGMLVSIENEALTFIETIDDLKSMLFDIKKSTSDLVKQQESMETKITDGLNLYDDKLSTALEAATAASYAQTDLVAQISHLRDIFARVDTNSASYLSSLNSVRTIITDISALDRIKRDAIGRELTHRNSMLENAQASIDISTENIRNINTETSSDLLSLSTQAENISRSMDDILETLKKIPSKKRITP